MEGKNQFLLKAITKNKAVQYYPNFALFLLNFVFRKCGYRIPQMWVFPFRKRGSYLFFHKFSTNFSTSQYYLIVILQEQIHREDLQTHQKYKMYQNATLQLAI